jgi:succinate dehydrogenase / fumarate reductase membrane anchor subunit
MSLQSPLARVLGHGSAKDGVHHWWVQRLTSIALVPLTVWFLVALLALPLHDRASVAAWVAQGWTPLLLIVFIVIATWHSRLGVQVVVEDYVPSAGTKTFTLILSSFAHFFVAAAAIFAVLKVAFE